MKMYSRDDLTNMQNIGNEDLDDEDDEDDDDTKFPSKLVIKNSHSLIKCKNQKVSLIIL